MREGWKILGWIKSTGVYHGGGTTEGLEDVGE